MNWIPKELVRSYLLCWLNYCGGKFENISEVYEKTLFWTKRLSGLGFGHLPICVIADLGQLLLLGSKYPFQSLVEFEPYPVEKKIRLKYQGGFLSQIWQNPDFQRVSELIQFSSTKEDLILRTLEIILGEVRDLFQAPILINPVDLRVQQRGVHFNIPEEFQRLKEWLKDDLFFLHQLDQFLNLFPIQKELFQVEDLYELEHYDVFDKSHIRVLGRQIKKIQRLIPSWDAHVFKKRESEEIETEHTDEGYYPTGGLSELTTKGSLENLVFSELVYIEEEEPLDLFDIRYFEQELLYYMRDSGQLRRKRRCLNIVLEQDPAFDITYPTHRYKFSSFLAAFILRVIEDLQEIFASENFIVKIFIDEKNAEVGENLKLLKLFLKEEILQNLVLFPQEKKASKSYSFSWLLDPKRKIHTLFLSTHPPSKELKDQAKELQLIPVQMGDFTQQPPQTKLKLDLNREVIPQLAFLRDVLIAEMIKIL